MPYQHIHLGMWYLYIFIPINNRNNNNVYGILLMVLKSRFILMVKISYIKEE